MMAVVAQSMGIWLSGEFGRSMLFVSVGVATVTFVPGGGGECVCLSELENCRKSIAVDGYSGNCTRREGDIFSSRLRIPLVTCS